MSEMALSIMMSSLITIGRTPFVAAFELLLGTLRTGLLVVSETLVPDFRVVVDCRLVC
jgi:hypothetical protein